MSYIRNTWYTAAWDHEVAAGRLLSRKLLGEPVVLFRDSSGQPRALQDRCPHRFIPLSHGFHCGNALRCAYHGLEFDGSGRCVRNPHGDGAIPDAARVRAYPVVERHSVLWIWMGDEALADASRITDLARSMDPEKRLVGKDYLLARAHYQLEVDNILDLSHIEFLHGSTLGSDAVKHAETEVIQEGDTVHSRRLTRNEIVSPSLAQTYGIPADQPVDRWLDVSFDPPAQMELWSGWAPAGTPDPRRVGKRIPFIHLFTPETETTTHYWFATSYPRKMGEEGERRAQHDIAYLRRPFEEEDLPILELQQRSMGSANFWSLRPVLLPSDAAAVRARRVIDELLRLEGVADASTAALPQRGRADEATLTLRVARRATEAEGVCSFDLVDPAGAPLPAFEAGAHLDVHMKPGLRRQYSLCNSPSDRNKYQIAVLRDPASRGGSAYMHEQIQEGSELVVGLPRNRFALREDAKRSLLMAGGIGITPLLAMADRLHATGAAFELHAFARSASRAAFVDRLRRSAYAAAVHLHFDDQSPAGRPDLATIFSRPGSTDRLYICGPAGFIKACRTQALSAGWDASRVHQEYFQAATPADAAQTAFSVELGRSGRSIEVRAGQSIVAALRAVGVQVPTSCEQGVCGTCLTRVLAGTPDHRDSYLTPEERQRGEFILPCCSRAASARLVLDL